MEKQDFEITPEELAQDREQYILVDVREAVEQTGPSGAIAGAILVTLGEDLSRFLATTDPQQHYVFICERGRRSAQALFEARAYGFQNVKSLQGGMALWRACGMKD